MAEFKCPNGHTFWFDGIGSDGEVYNCGLCMAEGLTPFQHPIPPQFKAYTPEAPRVVEAPQGPLVIELPESRPTPPAEETMTVRELADAVGATDLRKFIPALNRAGVNATKGEDLVPRSLRGRIQVTPGKRAEAVTA